MLHSPDVEVAGQVKLTLQPRGTKRAPKKDSALQGCNMNWGALCARRVFVP